MAIKWRNNHEVTTLTKGLGSSLVEVVDKGLNGGRFSYSYAGRTVGAAIDTRPRGYDATPATYKSASTNTLNFIKFFSGTFNSDTLNRT